MTMPEAPNATALAAPALSLSTSTSSSMQQQSAAPSSSSSGGGGGGGGLASSAARGPSQSTPSKPKKHAHPHHYLAAASSLLARGGKDKFTTRHLASLDFLLNIPMGNEGRIREQGAAAEHALNTNRYDGDLLGHLSSDEQQQQQQLLQQMQDSEYFGPNSPIDAAGAKKLPGPFAPTVRVPPMFRHILARISDQGALVRRWEEQLLLRGPMLSPAPPSSSSSVPQRNSTPPPAPPSDSTRQSGIHPNLNPNPNPSDPTRQSGILRSRMFFTRARSYPAAVFSVIGYDVLKEKAKIEKLLKEDQKVRP